MPKSYKSLLSSDEQEVREDVENLGVLPAMQKWAPDGDLTSFWNYCKEITGNEKIKLYNEVAATPIDCVGDLLLAAILKKIASLEQENERLRKGMLEREDTENHKHERLRLEAVQLLKLIT